MRHSRTASACPRSMVTLVVWLRQPCCQSRHWGSRLRLPLSRLKHRQPAWPSRSKCRVTSQLGSHTRGMLIVTRSGGCAIKHRGGMMTLSGPQSQPSPSQPRRWQSSCSMSAHVRRYVFPCPLLLACPLNSSKKQKSKGGKHTIPHSHVGKEAISQTISALEQWRLSNAYRYANDKYAQDPLRSDNRIRTIEAAMKHDEPKRVQSSQALKAAGTSSGEPPYYQACIVLMTPFPSKTPTQRKSSSAVPPGACRNFQVNSVSMLVCGMQPCFFSPPQQLCVATVHGSSVGPICSCLRSPWVVSTKQGR
jgi:hypothetical protein